MWRGSCTAVTACFPYVCTVGLIHETYYVRCWLHAYRYKRPSRILCLAENSNGSSLLAWKMRGGRKGKMKEGKIASLRCVETRIYNPGRFDNDMQPCLKIVSWSTWCWMRRLAVTAKTSWNAQHPVEVPLPPIPYYSIPDL